ncbi:hypothetical protein [Methylobacterium iners]|uniref:Uncharacterized protein n=1 Tax=Methylobacterium iners TaxID=418707 RepID=A0ABQ4RY86_9HYPH|nr:hypothetical protein [Methylobacterium iners]GJD95769.1 hypothetical protein OCOJLMKI_2983 [Methylobacterium iners]
MIEPVILEVMHRLNEPVPALVQGLGSASLVRSARTRPGRTETSSRWVDHWTKRAQDQVDALVRAYAAGPIEADHLAQLDRLIALLDAGTDETSKTYRRYEKLTKGFLKQLRASAPADAAAFAAQRDRIFGDWARAALVRSELILALRALRARYRPDAGTGDIFDNPDDLTAYLRGVAA